MKRILLVLSLILFIPLNAAAQAKWQEGVHYNVIAEKATEKKQVMEFFSFWCPHCFSFEPLVKSMKNKLADDVDFKKVHVNFMGFTSPKIQDEATRGMMVARALKKEEQLNGAIFKYVHVQRSKITSLNDIKNIFVVNGVEPADFDKMASSFGVNSLVQMNNKNINQYRKHVSSVPNFIINGKYQAVFNKDRNLTQDDMVDLVVWLSTQK
ncbi:MAG: thiol:disulfide interchange protein DsbA/DsbL [Paraglaciecola sp.]|uniref:thiol:disulfide interchange protein DsbA/DsbL n=1 Tax=Paraglaciecola TaxID=1621534 RepID=UPI00105C00A6|nr:thiol:disulfide interchange protein DsbA/DsbL [Paraglaciecola marina]